MHLLAIDNITVARETAPVYADGINTSLPGTAVAAKASVQPITGKERELLPEGERNKGGITVYSTFQFLTGDIITYNGVQYRVLPVKNWNIPGVGLQHHRVQALAE